MKLKFTYSQKLKILPVAVLAAMLLIYVVTVSRTVQLNRYCKINTAQNLSPSELSLQLDSLNIRLSKVNQLTGNNDPAKSTDPLLNFISTTLVPSGKLVEYLPLHEFRIQNHLVSTRIAVIESDYKSLLIFLNNLEKNYLEGKVASVKFEKETNIRIGRKRLLMTLYIQSITDEKSNEQI